MKSYSFLIFETIRLITAVKIVKTAIITNIHIPKKGRITVNIGTACPKVIVFQENMYPSNNTPK